MTKRTGSGSIKGSGNNAPQKVQRSDGKLTTVWKSIFGGRCGPKNTKKLRDATSYLCADMAASSATEVHPKHYSVTNDGEKVFLEEGSHIEAVNLKEANFAEANLGKKFSDMKNVSFKNDSSFKNTNLGSSTVKYEKNAAGQWAPKREAKIENVELKQQFNGADLSASDMSNTSNGQKSAFTKAEGLAPSGPRQLQNSPLKNNAGGRSASRRGHAGRWGFFLKK